MHLSLQPVPKQKPNSAIHRTNWKFKIMNIKRRIFDIIFIITSAMILILLSEYGLLEKYMAFSLIPILIAYQL